MDGLPKNYRIRVPPVHPFAQTRLNDMDYLRNHEARYAVEYFGQLQKVSTRLGFELRGRTTTEHNQRAPDFVNALLNYSYALLQTYVRRATNAIGLDNTIPFIHEMGQSRGMVYDLMELWRTNSDYAVVQTLEQLNAKDRNHYLTYTYEAMLSGKTIRLLFMNFKLGLKLEEIILNVRRFASFLMGRSNHLEFALKPVAVKEAFEEDAMKGMILTKSYRQEARSLVWLPPVRFGRENPVILHSESC